jgi:hypothetical protein
MDIAIIWKNGMREGRIETDGCELERCNTDPVRGEITGNRYKLTGEGECRVEINVSKAISTDKPALVAVMDSANAFSFFLRDVNRNWPIYIPSYGVVVTEAEDKRSYCEIESCIRQNGLKTRIEQLETSEEETYDKASMATRKMRCPIWLGLSRDIRIFAMAFRDDIIGGVTEFAGDRHIYGIGKTTDWIQPQFHSKDVHLPENDNKNVYFSYMIGKGWGCADNITRWIEEGVLPILRARLDEEDIIYEITAFVTLEKSELKPANLRGSHYLMADRFGSGPVFSDEQKKKCDSIIEEETVREEETVLYLKVEAKNISRVPRYAWFTNPTPTLKGYRYDGNTGFGVYDSGRICTISKMDGKPLKNSEASVLVKPGKSAIFEVLIPHQPISGERARELATQDFNARYAECCRFWRQKLDTAAHVKVPEKRVNEMIRAGLLHLDLVSYGLEPDGVVAPTIGMYTPIGSESAPIVQFFNSMGWGKLAERAANYFVEKQHDDGSAENVEGYHIETGGMLYILGEHYRYTRNDEWVERIKGNVLKACDYLVKWIRRNERPELLNRGFGMIDGRVADPVDMYHSYALNAFAYMGLSRAAGMLGNCDPKAADNVREEAAKLKENIRSTFFSQMARSPVVPLGDGSWCPTSPPWPENRGPVCIHADGGRWSTHGAITTRDSIIGPLWLIFAGILDPNEEAASFLINYHSEMMYIRNVAYTQPYYSRHPWVHLMRNEAKAFLKAYYNGFSGLADRETYTFWEHYSRCTPHKTHEEGWFLMETRWMLYSEYQKTLRLLPGVPRAWMEDGKEIEVRNACSHFGKLSFYVKSHIAEGKILARVECCPERKPDIVEVRLPHPEGRKAVYASEGVYNEGRESVIISNFQGAAEIELRF